MDSLSGFRLLLLALEPFLGPGVDESSFQPVNVKGDDLLHRCLCREINHTPPGSSTRPPSCRRRCGSRSF